MPKRPDHRRLKATRSYTVTETAQTLGVSKGTVRSWLRNGLPALTMQRPTLVLGDHLRAYIQERRQKARFKLGVEELYCFSCKEPHSPMGNLVDAISQTVRTVRLQGLCPRCGKTSNRIIRRSALPGYCEIFDVAIRGATTA